MVLKSLVWTCLDTHVTSSTFFVIFCHVLLVVLVIGSVGRLFVIGRCHQNMSFVRTALSSEPAQLLHTTSKIKRHFETKMQAAFKTLHVIDSAGKDEFILPIFNIQPNILSDSDR